MDILGYNPKEANRIMSSDYAIVTIDGSQAGLVQSVQAGYGHQVIPRFEAGSHHIYYVTGQGIGNISASRAVGVDFVAWQGIDKSANGELIPVTIESNATGSFGESFVGAGGQTKSLKYRGGVIQNYTVAFNVSGLDVSESVQVMCASLEK
jgi:hypothetical protein